MNKADINDIDLEAEREGLALRRLNDLVPENHSKNFKSHLATCKVLDEFFDRYGCGKYLGQKLLK